MATGTGKPRNIYEIDDLAEMFQAMTALDIPCKGLKTLDQMKDRVRDELNQSAKAPRWTAGQAFSVLSEAKDEDTRKRLDLLGLYNAAEKCLDKVDDKILHLLQQNVSNVQEKLHNHKVEIAQKEYFLLVAGETGSGKSSLVNLILGEELLPYSILSTTSTICELKYGEERKIVAHFKEQDPETGLPTKVIGLQEPLGSTEKNYLEQISPYVHVKSEREKGSIYKKIELFWPQNLLQRGVVIIDSPGVGESDIMDEIVTQYLPQAFAFIYVINSANAGGVQKDRLEKLLEEVRKVSLEKQGELPSKCALFVCNKWDQVPKKEVKEVKNHVVRNLQRCWPGLDPESQIIFMSTTKASKGQNLGIITEEFSSLMKGMRCMVLKSIEARLEIHWKWLDYLLSRIIFQAKAFLMNASRDRAMVAEKMAQILFRLTVIETEQNAVMDDLRRQMNKRVRDAMAQLKGYLSSEEVKDRFTSWTLDDVPKVEGSWEVTKNQIMKVLSNRLQEIVEHWEEDKQVFTNARESLVKHFQLRFKYVEEQLRNLQVTVTADDVDVSQKAPLDTGFTTAEKVIIGATSPIWLPLGLVALVIGAPIVGIVAIKEKIEDKKKVQKYEANKCAFMAKLSEDYLAVAQNELVLQQFVKEQLQDAKLCLKQIEARIPELIQADKMLCLELIDETRSIKEIQESYEPIMDEGTDLRGKLAAFGFIEVRANEISSEELDWKEDMSSRLGIGAYGAVYQGTMKRHGAGVQPVALKVYNEALDAKNASEIMVEVQLLRKLENPFIVKFYGTSLLKEQNAVRVILVMEKCKGNLKSHLFQNRESVPARSSNPAVFREVCRWAKQLTTALANIHEQGVIHRDLKLENVLLSEENSVKITDVGVSKPAIDITGTVAGTPVYIAPEVFNSQVYDCKADIYSLGIILWEMWFGEQAFANAPCKSLAGFFRYVDSGNRPENLKGCKPPTPHWKKLMNQCWNGNPKKRPTARECEKEMAKIYNENVDKL